MTTATTTDRVRLGDGPTYFAPRGKLTDTLFTRGGTATGEYRVLKHAVVFYAPDGPPRVALITNRFGERFYVSAGRGQNGRTRYLFGLDDSDRQWAGIPDGFLEARKSAERVAALFGR